MANRYSTMKAPASRAPMFTPAAASREKVEGRKAWRAITRLGDRPFERAMVMKSSCRVAIRSERSSR